MTRRRTGEVVDAVSRPARWSVVLVRMAALVLPGSVRERYRREFRAELFGMDRSQQLRHAGGVLFSVWALRRAVTSRPLTSRRQR